MTLVRDANLVDLLHILVRIDYSHLDSNKLFSSEVVCMDALAYKMTPSYYNLKIGSMILCQISGYLHIKKYRGELNEKVLFMSAAFVEHVKVYGDKRDNI
jgi:hypothetical protein